MNELLAEQLRRARIEEENIQLKGLLLGHHLQRVQAEIERLTAELEQQQPALVPTPKQ